MDAFRHIIRAAAVAMAGLLASCIDGHEEVWLNADGSGRAELTYELPAAAAKFQGGENGVRKMVGDFLHNAPEIRNSSFEVTAQDGRLKIHVQGSFDSVLELKGISKSGEMKQLPASASGLTGSTDISMSGRTVDFSRTIDAGNALPGSSFMPASQFEKRSLSYVVHLPMVPLESNATRTEDDGRTLVWEFPLAQAIQGPVTTHFKAAVPVPRWMMASAGAAVAGAGALAFLGLRKLRGSGKTSR